MQQTTLEAFELSKKKKHSAGNFRAANNKQTDFFADIHYVHTQNYANKFNIQLCVTFYEFAIHVVY